jgi:transposase-like protein
LLEGRPLSQVCESYGLAPTQFYQWQKTFFENGTAAFEPATNGRKDSQAQKLEQENARLKAKLANKDEVIAEIMASHVALKKSLGED